MAEPLLRRRFGNRTWDGILRGTAAIALGSIGIILWLPGATTLVVFVLLTLGCHGPLSPFLPATYEPILLLYGQLYPPLLIALLGAVTSAAAEYLNYHLYLALDCDSFDRVLRSDAARPNYGSLRPAALPRDLDLRLVAAAGLGGADPRLAFPLFGPSIPRRVRGRPDPQVLAPRRGRAPLDAEWRDRARDRGRVCGGHAPRSAPPASRRAGDGVAMWLRARLVSALIRGLALVIWLLTPPATWFAEWRERRRRRK